jgi:hypothetical protein
MDPGSLRPDGHFYVEVSVDELGSKRAEYVLAETRELTIRFEEPGRLTVTVAGYVGSGYEDAIDVELSRVEADGEVSRGGVGPGRARIDEEGRWTKDAVAPGDYRIELHVRSGDHSAWTVSSTPVTIRPGENTKTVALPRLHTLTVLTEDLPASARLRISSVGEGPRIGGGMPRSPTEGKVVFRGLPAGRYTVRTFGRGDAQMTVTLPGPSVVKFVAEEVNAISVRITDPDGLFARAGLRTGDLIVGIDGAEFDSMRKMYARMILAAEEGPVKLLVLRGTAKVEISVDLSGLIEGEREPGAQLEPASR